MWKAINATTDFSPREWGLSPRLHEDQQRLDTFPLASGGYPLGALNTLSRYFSSREWGLSRNEN